MTFTFRQFLTVCRKINLKEKKITDGILFTGEYNGQLVRIPVHFHRGGKDIPTGTLSSYLKRLGLKSIMDLYDILNN